VTDWSWHLRAWRAGARWDGTRALVQDWLLSLPSEADSLILLGGSAGWMMSSLFLQRFRSVVLIDIDPWAGRLFKLRHRGALRAGRTHLHFMPGDAYALMDEALERQPQACVLFDNFLGLDTLYTRDLQHSARRLRALRQRLKGRVWGSVHDRYSGPGCADWAQAQCWQLEPQSLRATAGEKLSAALYQSVQARDQWLDHGTDNIFAAGTQVRLIPWPLVAGRWHWLEAGWVGSA